MTEARVRSGLAVGAAVRLGAALGLAVTVVRKGEEESGAIAIKLYRGPGACEVLVQGRSAKGALGWLRATGPAPVAEPECDAYLARARARDPDLWIVEIEDREGRHLFDGPVLAD